MCEQGHIQCMWYQLKDAQSRRLGILVKDTLINEILSIQVGREEGKVGEGACGFMLQDLG